MSQPTAQQIQDAFENLLVRGQDQDTINQFFAQDVELPEDSYLTAEFVRADRGAIQVGPLTDAGDGRFVQLVTIQVEITIQPEDDEN